MARPLRGKRSLVVRQNVRETSVIKDADGDPAAQMGADDVLLPVIDALLLAQRKDGGPHVQVVSPSDAPDIPDTGDPVDLLHFVHRHRVIDIRLDARFLRHGISYRRAQVGRVMQLGPVPKTLQYVRIHLVSARTHWRQKPASSHDSIKGFRLLSVVPAAGPHQLRPKVQLSINAVKGGQLLSAVGDAPGSTAPDDPRIRLPS